MPKTFYHGSPHLFDTLRKGSWVTPHVKDAAVFGVPWDSTELQSSGGTDGRPPEKLRYKGEPSADHPVYVYAVDAPAVRSAKTNMGADYDWNHQVEKDTPVRLVRVIRSWHAELLDHPKVKHAEVVTELQPHQKRVAEKIKNQRGLVVAHGLGSGKTLSAIAAMEGIGGDTAVVVPAALKANYEKEIKKHVVGEPKANISISTLQSVARKREAPEQQNLVVDEAHRLRDTETAGYQTMMQSPAQKRLLLTGSPLYNRPSDLAALVNLASGERLLPANTAAFEKEYIATKKVSPGLLARLRGIKPGEERSLKNTEKLREIINTWVDYHENGQENFPTRNDRTIEVPMEERQLATYKSLLNQAPAWARYKIKRNLPLSKQESAALNSFLTGTRQVSTSLGAHATDLTPEQVAAQSPKIRAAVGSLRDRLNKDPAHRAVIYSNYLQAGLDPYETELKRNNIRYGKFTGEMTKSERNAMVRDYNEGRLNALMLSSAGGEGLDLKGTRQIQVLEPHFNKEKIEQVAGRGIRYGSHAELPAEQRNVDVEHYVSTLPKPGRLRSLLGAKQETSVDQYLQRLSKDKDDLNQQVRALMTKESRAIVPALVEVFCGS